VHVSAPDALIDSLVNQGRGPDLSLKSGVCITNRVNVIKLLVKNLMHLDGVVFKFVNLQHCVSKTDCMLETRRCQFFVLQHQGVDFVEVAVQEARHNIVLILIDFVAVKVFVLLYKLL
jgi:hypothetical protein